MDTFAVLGLSLGVFFCVQSCCYCSILKDISAVRENQSSLKNKCFVCTYEKHMVKYHRQFASPLQSVHVHSDGEDPA